MRQKSKELSDGDQKVDYITLKNSNRERGMRRKEKDVRSLALINEFVERSESFQAEL
jgi:hypothetical protein